jgi:hypothetical protein
MTLNPHRGHHAPARDWLRWTAIAIEVALVTIVAATILAVTPARYPAHTHPPASTATGGHRATSRRRDHVAPTATRTPTAGRGPGVPAPGVHAGLIAQWTRVAVCEEGGWVGASGPAFPDSLGITAANWRAYGGTTDVSPAAQVAVAERIQSQVPDQEGCAPW